MCHMWTGKKNYNWIFLWCFCFKISQNFPKIFFLNTYVFLSSSPPATVKSNPKKTHPNVSQIILKEITKTLNYRKIIVNIVIVTRALFFNFLWRKFVSRTILAKSFLLTSLEKKKAHDLAEAKHHKRMSHL